MRNIYLFIDGLISIGLLSLSVVSLLKYGYKKSINRLFAFFSILTAFWIISNHVSNDIDMPNNVALFADYIVFSSSLGFGIVLMQFVAKLSDVKKIIPIVKYSVTPLWLLGLLCFTPLIVESVEVLPGDTVYTINFGPLVYVYGVALFFVLSVIAYGMYSGLRHLRGVKRRQLMSVAIGLAISLPIVLSLSFIIPVLTGIFSITEFGITPLIILVASLYYGVVRYQLFDVRLAAVRTVAYILSLLTLSIAYYGLAYAVSIILFKGQTSSTVSVSPVNIILALLLAFIFQPIKKFFDRVTNKIFYKDNYDTDDFFARLNRTLSFTTNLRDLLEWGAFEIGKTLKSDQAFFFIYTGDGHYISAGTDGHKRIPKSDARMIDEFYHNNPKIIMTSMLERSNPIRRMLLSHRVELVLTLVKEGKIIGYLCLGEHKNSGYTDRDLRALHTISDEMVIAIQNALAVQEIRELNSTLQQRVNNATKELRASNVALRKLDKVKDEFLSIASHQLRTPLTSVKGYISMVLDGDVGPINESQKELLDEAFVSSERMVHLINDFLNVSRLQTGKFAIEKRPTDLAKVVKEVIDSLQPSAISRNLKYALHIDKNIPIIEADEDKIRQVIMNFADNALYYSHEHTKIDVNLRIEGCDIVYTVKDTGIGVPIDEQARLFTKFFRATNARKARPDGTGVGLFLAKKVVDGHNGRIMFESVEGKGSVFGFRMPIKVCEKKPTPVEMPNGKELIRKKEVVSI